MLIHCHDRWPEFQSLGMQTPEEDFRAVEKLLLEHDPRIVIEVGCWAGAMTRLFCEYRRMVYSIDHFQGSADHSGTLLRQHGGSMALFRAYAHNLGDDYLKNAIPIVGTSKVIASVWPERFKADLVYIDASHEYQDVADDIRAWLPHVRQGGVIAGHDYGGFPGVTKAVDELGCDGVESLVWHKLVR